MKCIAHNCNHCSSQHEGRSICVEPDDDGWICEGCWILLTKPSQSNPLQGYQMPADGRFDVPPLPSYICTGDLEEKNFSNSFNLLEITIKDIEL